VHTHAHTLLLGSAFGLRSWSIALQPITSLLWLAPFKQHLSEWHFDRNAHARHEVQLWL